MKVKYQNRNLFLNSNSAGGFKQKFIGFYFIDCNQKITRKRIRKCIFIST